MSSSEEYESGSDYSSPGSESSSLETDSDDSYSYPFKDIELDRFSSFDDLSSDALMSKILDSLPVYDPPNSDSEGEFEYPDPDLYAVHDADKEDEMRVIEDNEDGPSYLPKSDELYLNWIDEFELIMYPSDWGDIDEPEDEKDADAPVEQKEEETPKSPVSVTVAEEVEPSPMSIADTSATTVSSIQEKRERTTRSQQLRQSMSSKKRKGTTPLSPTFSHRQTTPDPSQSQQAVRRSQSTSSASKRPSRSASPRKDRVTRANTARQKVRDRIAKQMDRKMGLGAKMHLRVAKKVKVYGETAVIRYIGEIDDPTMPGEVYGIEFSHRSERGNNDGCSPSGTRYFECQPGQGAFVQKGLIKPARKHARRRARFVGNVNAFERDNLLKERRNNRRRRGKAARKLGPRDIGRSDYRPREYDIKEDTSDFLAPKKATKSRSSADVKVRKKAGPRDVGRSKYRPQQFVDVPRSDSVSNRSVSPRGGPRSVPKKLGPREARKKRTNSNWRPPEYEIKESGSFLEDRVVRSKSNSQQRRVPKKKGPRDYRNARGEAAGESPRHIHNEHAPQRKRNKSRDRRRRRRRSSSSNQVESGVSSPRSEDDFAPDPATD